MSTTQPYKYHFPPLFGAPNPIIIIPCEITCDSNNRTMEGLTNQYSNIQLIFNIKYNNYKSSTVLQGMEGSPLPQYLFNLTIYLITLIKSKIPAFILLINIMLQIILQFRCINYHFKYPYLIL